MEKRHKAVLMPISDTLPGPGAYEVDLVDSAEDPIPVSQKTDSIHSFGHGTAQDVTSTSQAPKKSLPKEM